MTLNKEKTLEYLLNLDKTKDLDAIGYNMNEYLKMSAYYWGISALNLLSQSEKIDKEKLIEFIKRCHNEDGGFGGSIGHDSQLTCTHYAVLLLTQFETEFDTESVCKYIKSLQKQDGSFMGDIWGEVDIRFSYCAVSSLKLMNKLNSDYIDLDKAIEFILKCQNFDGGFGAIPLAESHAAYTFCASGFLSITNSFDNIDTNRLGQWLASRQTHLGGFNGRPEKLPDVCYSWWVLSSLYMMGKENLIDEKALIGFILDCQDSDGGFSDRPGNGADVFHTFFALSALSLMGYGELNQIDPTYAINREFTKKLY